MHGKLVGKFVDTYIPVPWIFMDPIGTIKDPLLTNQDFTVHGCFRCTQMVFPSVPGHVSPRVRHIGHGSRCSQGSVGSGKNRYDMTTAVVGWMVDFYLINPIKRTMIDMIARFDHDEANFQP